MKDQQARDAAEQARGTAQEALDAVDALHLRLDQLIDVVSEVVSASVTENVRQQVNSMTTAAMETLRRVENNQTAIDVQRSSIDAAEMIGVLEVEIHETREEVAAIGQMARDALAQSSAVRSVLTDFGQRTTRLSPKGL